MRLTTLKIEGDDDIVRLRMTGQETARICGFAKFAETRIVTALLELGRNLVQHGGGGRLTLSLDADGPRVLLSAEAADQGPGIPDVEAWLNGSAPVAGDRPGLGLGLRGVHRMADRFDIETGPEGTRVAVGFCTPLTPGALAETARAVGEALAGMRRADPAAMLAQQNRELLDALEERDLLMAEVHHRTKNNLALVSGLMRLSRSGARSEETRDVLRDLELRVKAITALHDRLQRASTADRTPLVPLLRDVAEQARAAFSTADLEVSVVVTGEAPPIKGNAATDIALAAGELLTNACKHAFEGRSQGRIHLSVRREDGMLKLVVSDDGRGLTEGMERPERSDSLGWRMIRTMVQKHGGFVRTSSTEGLTVELGFGEAHLGLETELKA
ncbi:sensor histidine kinase [Limimaricola pyoseonensis]|uniref:histidine kinase n=1 Tax=Limimaricola pyoseonensis TaxID=521013 RepID=A0A1G7D8N6_9RHOB|nr:ATP-binding protein [Limimaricola pyoseonensis]SDE47869.1 Two-component sensor histidine kinase, contains HisKA and HATPase domains [Limimaricola pyoseonensis]